MRTYWILVLCVVAPCGHVPLLAQNSLPTKAQVRGEYLYSAGQAGRTIIASDGTAQSIQPLVYFKNTLQLLRFGKACVLEENTFVNNQPGIRTCGKWTMKADTLVLIFEGNDKRYYERYLWSENGHLTPLTGYKYYIKRAP